MSPAGGGGGAEPGMVTARKSRLLGWREKEGPVSAAAAAAAGAPTCSRVAHAGLAAAMMVRGFQSSHRTFPSGPWRLTASKTHIMGSRRMWRSEL